MNRVCKMNNTGRESIADFSDETYISRLNSEILSLNAQERVNWVLENLPGKKVLTSSFGIQSALMLHLVTQQVPDIPIILLDTGYLFPETYHYIDELTSRLDLKLFVYRANMTAAWQESRYGQLWDQGVTGIEHFNQINKIEPLERALKEMDANCWFAGLRREQSSSRSELPIIRVQDGRIKIHPIIDWNNKAVYQYLEKHNLPHHPLWEKGYTSVGDVNTSMPNEQGKRDEDTRYFGLKRECGIHQ